MTLTFQTRLKQIAIEGSHVPQENGQSEYSLANAILYYLEKEAEKARKIRLLETKTPLQGLPKMTNDYTSKEQRMEHLPKIVYWLGVLGILSVIFTLIYFYVA